MSTQRTSSRYLINIPFQTDRKFSRSCNRRSSACWPFCCPHGFIRSREDKFFQRVSGATIRSRTSVRVTGKRVRQFLDWGEIQSEGNSDYRNYRGPIKDKNVAIYFRRFSFQFVWFLFPGIEDLEQAKDTEIQGLADVGRMRHESDKNDSLGTCSATTREGM
jgi:hypothetical protein